MISVRYGLNSKTLFERALYIAAKISPEAARLRLKSDRINNSYRVHEDTSE